MQEASRDRHQSSLIFIQQLMLAAAISVCLVSSLWPLILEPTESEMVKNAIFVDTHRSIFGYQCFSFIAYIVAALVLRRRRSSPENRSFTDSLRALNRTCAWILALPLIFLLWSFSETSNIHAAGLVIVSSTIVALCFYSNFALIHPKITSIFRDWSDRQHQRLSLTLVLALCIATSVMTSHFAIVRHQMLGTGSFDLGIFVQIIWHSLHGNPFGISFFESGSHLSTHFDPVLYLFLPFYAASPSPETLLILQATWVAFGALPLYLLATHHLESPHKGLVFAALYCLYPAMHGVVLVDFHSITLLPTPTLFALYFLEKGQWKRYAVGIGVMLLVREEVPLMCALLGVYAVVFRRAYWPGVITIVVSVAYLYIVRTHIMPVSEIIGVGNDSVEGFANRYSTIIRNPEAGISSAIGSLINNPSYIGSRVLRRHGFLIQILLPLGFLPLLARRYWLLLAYPAAGILLSSRSAIPNIYFHYVSTLIPFVLAASILGFKQVESLCKRLHKAGVVTAGAVPSVLIWVLVASTLMSANFGLLSANKNFQGWSSHYSRELSEEGERRVAFLRSLETQLAENVSVAASGNLVAHFAEREQVWDFPDHMPQGPKPLPDVTVLNLRVMKEERVEAWQEISDNYKRVIKYEKDILVFLKKGSKVKIDTEALRVAALPSSTTSYRR